jgi:hypothetical protein
LYALIDDGAVSVLMAEDKGKLVGFYEQAGFTRDGAERTEEAWAHLPEIRYRRSL